VVVPIRESSESESLVSTPSKRSVEPVRRSGFVAVTDDSSASPKNGLLDGLARTEFCAPLRAFMSASL
jgi:hypothetical protein